MASNGVTLRRRADRQWHRHLPAAPLGEGRPRGQWRQGTRGGARQLVHLVRIRIEKNAVTAIDRVSCFTYK
jgi:hypothetical protein